MCVLHFFDQLFPKLLIFYTNPKFFVLIASSNLCLRMARLEYRGIYKRDMHVLAVGKWASSAGRIVTDGIGWNPSSDAGNAGDPVQK